MSRQCLDRHISSEGQLRTEVEAWTQQREAAKVKLVWQFTADRARSKLQRHYYGVRIN